MNRTVTSTIFASLFRRDPASREQPSQPERDSVDAWSAAGPAPCTARSVQAALDAGVTFEQWSTLTRDGMHGHANLDQTVAAVAAGAPVNLLPALARTIHLANVPLVMKTLTLWHYGDTAAATRALASLVTRHQMPLLRRTGQPDAIVDRDTVECEQACAAILAALIQHCPRPQTSK